jgi:hypothetical protein
MNDAEWKRYAKNFLKAELMRRDIGYEVLAEKLKDIGVDETYHSINTKINRGAFSFAFALQCLNAVGAHESVLLGNPNVK